MNLPPKKIKSILQAAALPGFGGNCGAAALAINEILFKNEGQLVGAFNAAFLKKNSPIGHIAVLHDGIFWDADAKPKPWEEIESWGMLDPEDPDHKATARKLKVPWNDESASEVSKEILLPPWIESHFDCSLLPDFRMALLEI